MRTYKNPQSDRIIDIVRQMGLVENTAHNLDPKYGGRMRFTKPNGSASVTVILSCTMVYRHIQNGKIEVARFNNKDVTRKVLAKAFRIKPEHKDGKGSIQAGKDKIAYVVSILEANGFVYDRVFKTTPLSNGRVRLLDPVVYVLPQTPLSVRVSVDRVRVYQRQLDNSYALLTKIKMKDMSRSALETLLSKWMPR